MAGTYSTDLTLIADGSSGNPTEASDYNQGATPSSGDTDNAIQGTTSFFALAPAQTNRSFSILADNGTGLTLNAEEVFTFYAFYAVPLVLGAFGDATPGVVAICGTATNAISTYAVDGDDTYYEGGWRQYTIDPRNTPTGELSGGGTGGTTSNTNQYYGIGYNQISGTNRQSPMGLDAVRYGRMTMSSTGGDNTSINNASPLSSSAANFPQMTDYDNYNAGGTPTFGSAVDSGFHRFGQIVEKNGAYICQGIIRLGIAGTNNEVYFNDTTRTVSFLDAFNTYADFNRLEIVNAASTVILDSMVFSGLGTTARGNFEMVDNASVDLDGCSFVDMGTFIFQSNATIDSSAFRRCNTITSGGATFTDCTFSRSNSTSAVSATTTEDFDNCTFVSDGTGYAIDLGNFSGTSTMDVNCTFTGYDSGTDANSGTGGNANSAIRVNLQNTSDSLTINVASGTTVPTVDNVGAAGTITVQQTVEYTVENIRSGTNLQLVEDQGGGTLVTIGGVDNVSATPTGEDSGFVTSADANNPGKFKVVYTYAYSADRNIYVAAVNVDFQSVYLNDVLGNTSDSIRITQIADRQYDPGSV